VAWLVYFSTTWSEYLIPVECSNIEPLIMQELGLSEKHTEQVSIGIEH